MRRCSLAVMLGSLFIFLSVAGQAPAVHVWDGAELQEGVVSVHADVGTLAGQAKELVYDRSWFGGREKLSELDWDLTGLVMGGLGVSVKPLDWMTVNAGAWTMLNEGSGQMYDYDWAISGLDWTDRSISDVKVVSSYLLDINASFRLFQVQGLTVNGLVGYKQDFWKWEDSFRELLYSVNGFRDYYEAGDGSSAINYEQLFRIPYLGLSGSWRLGKVVLDGYAMYSPLVSAEDKDFHILRNLLFRETFSGGSYVGAGLGAQADLTRHFYMAASGEVQVIPEIIGDMELTDGETGVTETASGAAGVSHASLSLLMKAGWKF